MRARGHVVLASSFLTLLVTAGCPGGCSSPAPAPPPLIATDQGAGPIREPVRPTDTAGDGAAVGTGSITGRVVLVRKVDAPPVTTVTADAATCGARYDPRSLVADGSGGLADCVVYLKGPKAPAGWPVRSSCTIDQKGCYFTPRVSIVPVGQTVTFLNSDDVPHDLTVQGTMNNYSPKTIPSHDKDDRLFAAPEVGIHLKCSRHPFMGGSITVAENPWYALTGANGEFKLENVPAGAWKIIAFHEVLGKTDRAGTPVTVTAEKETKLDLRFE
jgi:plastocyanin